MYIFESHYTSYHLKFRWLVVFNVPSTARSFREGTPFTVPCEGRDVIGIYFYSDKKKVPFDCMLQ